MRLVTGFNVCLEWINYTLVFAISALSLYLWSLDQVSIGAIAVAIALALRLNGMSHWITWELSALFENIGTVVDGMGTLSQSREVLDNDNATPIDVPNGAIEFDDVSFHYGKASKIICV